MGTTVVRYTTRADAADENERLVRQVIEELAETRPDGLRYAALRLADNSFVHIVQTDDGDNPLASSAAFKEFQRGIGDRVEGPPAPAEATLVGSYRLFAQ